MKNVLDILLNMEIPDPQKKQVKLKRLSETCGENVFFTIKELGYSRVAEIKKHEDIEVHTLLAGVVEPNLKDKALMEKFHALTPAELIKKMLQPGEIADLSIQIEKLSGYRKKTLEEVKKN